jgi:hypothetical protein
MQCLARSGRHPDTATMTLTNYGDAVMPLAMRGLEPKTLDPYMAGWHLGVLPALGHLPITEIGHGAIDRVVHTWIADGYGQSTIKNSLAALVRVLQQAVRDGLIDTTLFAACTAARIGEVSGCRLRDINTHTWRWTLRRQTTTSPGGLTDKATKGKRARVVPLIEELHEVVERRIAATDGHPGFSAVDRAPGRTNQHRRSARCHPLGRRRRPARLRAPTSPQPAPHRADVDGRRGRSDPRPPTYRRARLDHHDPALSAGQTRQRAVLPAEGEPPSVPSGRQDSNLRPLDPQHCRTNPAYLPKWQISRSRGCG